MQIEGSTALVAGGASGLGAATARLLSERGATVVIADLNDDAGQALAEELGATFVHTDVTDPDSVQSAVEKASDLRIAVCCAKCENQPASVFGATAT